MKIVTWNAARGRTENKLPAILDYYDPDIVAIQEVARPREPIPNVVWKGKNPNIGLLVWTRDRFEIEKLTSFKCRTELYQAVRIAEAGRHICNLFNLWVKPYAKCPRGECRYGYSLSAALQHAMASFHRQSNVVLGDTNILNRQSKDHYRELLRKKGLFSAYHEFHGSASGEERHATHRHRTQKTDHHIDVCFVPEIWRSRLHQVSVGSPRRWGRLSDHFPISIELDEPTTLARTGKSVGVRR